DFRSASCHVTQRDSTERKGEMTLQLQQQQQQQPCNNMCSSMKKKNETTRFIHHRYTAASPACAPSASSPFLFSLLHLVRWILLLTLLVVCVSQHHFQY